MPDDIKDAKPADGAKEEPAKPAAGGVTVEKTTILAKEGGEKPAQKEDPKEKVDPKGQKPSEAKASKKDEKGDPEDPSTELEADEKGFISLPRKVLLKRIANKTARELKSLFGTSDVDKILEMQKEYQDLKKDKVERDAKAEEERRAKLKEEERLKEDAKKEKDRADRAEAALAAKDEERLIERTDTQLTKVAGKHVDEEFVDYALSKFRKHVRGMSNRAVEKMTEEDVATWFADFAKEKPKMAKAAAADPKEKKEEKKVGLTTGAKLKPTAKPLDSGRFAGKTPRPGLPNSMSPAELKEYKAQKGLSW